jgi:hypothetical protein
LSFAGHLSTRESSNASAHPAETAKGLQSFIQLFDSPLRLIPFLPQLLDHISQVRH